MQSNIFMDKFILVFEITKCKCSKFKKTIFMTYFILKEKILEI